MKTKQTGFTLIELLVVVSIISILSVVGMVSYRQINARADDSKLESAVAQVQTALEMYKADNGFYPQEDTYKDDLVDYLGNFDVSLLSTSAFTYSTSADPAYSYTIQATYKTQDPETYTNP